LRGNYARACHRFADRARRSELLRRQRYDPRPRLACTYSWITHGADRPERRGQDYAAATRHGADRAHARARDLGRPRAGGVHASRHRVPAANDVAPQRRGQYPLCARRRQRAARAAHCPRLELSALVGLTGLERRPARKLSAGEQQRLALARALAKEPQILLLDEPTASLDPAATKAIEDVIRKVAASGIKVVMSTHDLGEAKRLAGEIVLVHRGRVIERGPAESFFSAPKTEEARRFITGELLV
jgi:ABC-type dipeptide/oligopeptide/nickel transport system ATPase component